MTLTLIHIGIIGGGNISDTRARAAREIDGIEIAAIHGRNREKTARLAHAYGGTIYNDLPASSPYEEKFGLHETTY